MTPQILPFWVQLVVPITVLHCDLIKGINYVIKLEYLAVYGRTYMGVPVGELQYDMRTFSNGTVLDGHVRPQRTVIGWRLGLGHKIFFCHRQKRDYFSGVSQRARGVTNV